MPWGNYSRSEEGCTSLFFGSGLRLCHDSPACPLTRRAGRILNECSYVAKNTSYILIFDRMMIMESLVREVLDGKKGAATRFYREYVPRVRRYLFCRLPSEKDVEEVLQDTFLSAFDSLPLYRGEAKVVTWILSIARHEAADFYRKRYVRQLVEKTSPLFEEMVAESGSPEFELRKAKLRKQFFKTYRGLSSQYQEVLSLRFELSMSVKEIAKRMKMSFKATESLLYRARQAFQVSYATQNRE